MRGSRCKTLRKQFKATFGRPVRMRMQVQERHIETPYDPSASDLVYYLPSEWRRLKSAYQRNKRG